MHTLKKRELPSNILRYVLLLLGGAVSVMPMIYMISTSLKPNGALYEFPPKFFPALDTVTLTRDIQIISAVQLKSGPVGDDCQLSARSRIAQNSGGIPSKTKL